ncbi:uncharacterized protein LOC119464900 [Dermacentor silvarum]|uniref:uncharacterized protein LOC119464900 n=1 Tax=Dermacentor silvarum TaxID=543639 RepID=UPI0018999263|nr:uncharacterized protein LOC119464900 [Dermacentor silvarum]
MSTVSTTQDDASEDPTSTSSSTTRTVAGSDGGMESNLLEMMSLSLNELQQLSALNDEGPRAPVNSFESLASDNPAGSNEDATSRRSSLGSSDRAGGRPQAALVRDDRTVTETISEEAKARRSSNGASAASLACVAVLMVAFLAAIAYGIFLFRLGHIPAPVKKTGAHRSANDTGADRG